MKKVKLLQARLDKKKTQGEMADLLGMSQSQYQRRESGHIAIIDDEWTKIAKVLEVEIDEIKENDFVSAILIIPVFIT